MNNEEMWEHVRLVTKWLDENSNVDDATSLLRIMKVAEEVGEVTAAVIGVTGQNPRKGFTHTWDDVRTELCDVILAAMVALHSIGGNSKETFAKHVEQRHARILELNEPKCACCAEKAHLQGDGKWWCGNCVLRCEVEEVETP